MWFVVRKKTYQRVLEEWGCAEHEALRITLQQEKDILDQQQNIADKNVILNSTEREKVLTDLQATLNLIRGYQRLLSFASCSDPQIIEANALLEKYGMRTEKDATYLGFKQGGAVRVPKPTHSDRVELDALFNPPLPGYPQSRWQREEEKWGAEAYGSGNVRIEAVAIGEGDDKEPGYTRAHVQFTDLDAESLTDIKAAGWSPSDDDLAAS